MTESAEAGQVKGSAASRSGLSGRGNGGWGRYARALGPGLITGASDDDPSGVATYAQAGARFGFGMLWASLLTFPLMAAVQEICDRTALATGQSLGGLIARRFTHRWRIAIGALIIVLCGANALNIAADLVAIGEGMHLLNAGPTTLWAVIAGLTILGLLVKFSYQVIARVFRLLCLALLSYVGVLFAVHLDWPTVLAHTVIPHIQFTKGYLTLLIAVLGTTISPYLFFWQTTNRVDEMREEDIGGASAVPLRRRLRSAAKSKLRLSRFDVFFGMAFSNFVMFAIIAATAATLGANGPVDISSAAEAATALRPVAGHLASMLFALGFIGSGMLAVPVLAGAGASEELLRLKTSTARRCVIQMCEYEPRLQLHKANLNELFEIRNHILHSVEDLLPNEQSAAETAVSALRICGGYVSKHSGISARDFNPLTSHEFEALQEKQRKNKTDQLKRRINEHRDIFERLNPVQVQRLRAKVPREDDLTWIEETIECPPAAKLLIKLDLSFDWNPDEFLRMEDLVQVSSV